MGMLGKIRIKIVKENEVPRTLWPWTCGCVWETHTTAASRRVGLDVYARHGLAVDANDSLLVPAVHREWAERDSKGIRCNKRAAPLIQLGLIEDKGDLVAVDDNDFSSGGCSLKAEIAAV